MNNLDVSAGGWSILSETRDAISDYRRLLNALGVRARRMGSQDPESAAQEALKRSLEKTLSQPAVAYYLSEELPLDQLMAWLHGVLRFVVIEEHNRADRRRELAGWARGADPGNRLDPSVRISAFAPVPEKIARNRSVPPGEIVSPSALTPPPKPKV